MVRAAIRRRDTAAVTVAVRGSRTNREKSTKIAKPPSASIDHAVRLIHAICGLAGSATLIEEIRADLAAALIEPLRQIYGVSDNQLGDQREQPTDFILRHIRGVHRAAVEN